VDFNISFLTAAHVVISLIAIVAGAVVCYGFLSARRLDLWTAEFLATTVLTSVTGFIFFPIERFTPGIGIGIVSLIVLAVAILARYYYGLAGRWRAAYVISSVAAFYFNVLVLVTQLFDKIPALKALAPTQSEPPFAMAQLVVLVAFIAIGVASTRRFRARADQSMTGVVARAGRNPTATKAYRGG
jgi:hypothetical protein